MGKPLFQRLSAHSDNCRETDSKSSGPCALGGSTPPSGTMENVERLRGFGETRPLFSFRANLPVLVIFGLFLRFVWQKYGRSFFTPILTKPVL